LEEKGIGKLFFDAINRCLERAGRMMRGGSIVDATLISASANLYMLARAGGSLCPA
jgi:IS5 family transposase